MALVCPYDCVTCFWRDVSQGRAHCVTAELCYQPASIPVLMARWASSEGAAKESLEEVMADYFGVIPSGLVTNPLQKAEERDTYVKRTPFNALIRQILGALFEAKNEDGFQGHIVEWTDEKFTLELTATDAK